MILPWLPLWLEYLFAGLLLFATIASAGVILTRTGRHPYLALLLLVPMVQIAAIWGLACTRWPAVESSEKENLKENAE